MTISEDYCILTLGSSCHEAVKNPDSKGKRMKKEYSYNGPIFIYRLLIIITLSLFGVIVLGSVYAAIRPANSGPLLRVGRAIPETQESILSGDIGIFTGIGRLRIPLSDSSTLILSIVFPYPAEDRAFYEELAARTDNFRTIATGYFTSLRRQTGIDEEAAKAEILNRYNAILRLGKIQVLYFNDLLILE